MRLNKCYGSIIREVLRKADAITVARRAVFNEAAKLAGSKKIHSIPNRVDLIDLTFT